MKKGVLIFIFALSVTLKAGDIEDMQYIYKLYQNKYYKESKEELEIFVRKYPNSKLYYSAMNLLGYNYYLLEEYDKSIEVFGKLTRSDFRDDAFYYLEMIAIKRDNEIYAKNYVDQISDKSGYKTKGIYSLAEYYYKKDKYNEAEEQYIKLTRFENEYYTDSMLKLGLINHKKEEFLRSNVYLEEYIKRENEGSRNIMLAKYLIAYSSEKIEDVKTADKYYKKVLSEHEDKEYAARSNYGLMRLALKKSDENAIKDYSEKLIGTDYEKEGFTAAGEYHYSKSNFETAEKYYGKILEKGQDIKIQYKYSLSQLKLGKTKEAFDSFSKLKGSEFESEYIYYTMYILYQNKEYDKIVKEYSEALKKEIKEEYRKDVYVFMAESAFLVKNYIKAREYYAKLDEKKYLYKAILTEYKVNDHERLEKKFNEYLTKYLNDKEYRRDIYMIMGNSYAAKGKNELAEKTYSSYLANEEDEAMRNNLAVVLLNQNKYSELLTNLDKATKNPANTYMRGLGYLGTGKNNEAEKTFKQLLKTDDQEYREKTYVRLTEVLFNLSKYEEVVKYTTEYMEKKYKENREEMMDRRGIAYFKLKEYNNALIVYEELTKSAKNKDYAFFMSGEVNYAKGDYEKAKKSYEKVILGYPDSKYRRLSLYWIITIAYGNNEYDEALNYIDFFVKKYPSGEYLEDILYYLGNIYIRQNKVGEALKEYEKLFEITKNEEVRQNITDVIVKLYFDSGNYEDALKWMEKLAETSYKTLWQGIIYEKQGKTDESVAKYKEITSDTENGDKANYYLGNYYLSKKQYEDSRNYYEKVDTFPTSEYKDDAIFKIGISYEEEGNYSRAITMFLKIKMMYEKSDLQDIVHIKIAENYEKTNNSQKAIEFYTEVYTKYKESTYYPIITERILAYYVSKKEYTKAKEYYNELKKIKPERAKEYIEVFKAGGVNIE